MSPHELLGRRFEFLTVAAPDFTLIAYETANDQCLVHFRDGVAGIRQYLRLSMVQQALQRGTIRESALAPFVLERRRA